MPCSIFDQVTHMKNQMPWWCTPKANTHVPVIHCFMYCLQISCVYRGQTNILDKGQTNILNSEFSWFLKCLECQKWIKQTIQKYQFQEQLRYSHGNLQTQHLPWLLSFSALSEVSRHHPSLDLHTCIKSMTHLTSSSLAQDVKSKGHIGNIHF